MFNWGWFTPSSAAPLRAAEGGGSERQPPFTPQEYDLAQRLLASKDADLTNLIFGKLMPIEEEDRTHPEAKQLEKTIHKLQEIIALHVSPSNPLSGGSLFSWLRGRRTPLDVVSVGQFMTPAVRESMSRSTMVTHVATELAQKLHNHPVSTGLLQVLLGVKLSLNPDTFQKLILKSIEAMTPIPVRSQTSETDFAHGVREELQATPERTDLETAVAKTPVVALQSPPSTAAGQLDQVQTLSAVVKDTLPDGKGENLPVTRQVTPPKSNIMLDTFPLVSTSLEITTTTSKCAGQPFGPNHSIAEEDAPVSLGLITALICGKYETAPEPVKAHAAKVRQNLGEKRMLLFRLLGVDNTDIAFREVIAPALSRRQRGVFSVSEYSNHVSKMAKIMFPNGTIDHKDRNEEEEEKEKDAMLRWSTELIRGAKPALQKVCLLLKKSLEELHSRKEATTSESKTTSTSIIGTWVKGLFYTTEKAPNVTDDIQRVIIVDTEMSALYESPIFKSIIAPLVYAEAQLYACGLSSDLSEQQTQKWALPAVVPDDKVHEMRFKDIAAAFRSKEGILSKVKELESPYVNGLLRELAQTIYSAPRVRDPKDLLINKLLEGGLNYAKDVQCAAQSDLEMLLRLLRESSRYSTPFSMLKSIDLSTAESDDIVDEVTTITKSEYTIDGMDALLDVVAAIQTPDVKSYKQGSTEAENPNLTKDITLATRISNVLFGSTTPLITEIQFKQTLKELREDIAHTLISKLSEVLGVKVNDDNLLQLASYVIKEPLKPRQRLNTLIALVLWAHSSIGELTQLCVLSKLSAQLKKDSSKDQEEKELIERIVTKHYESAAALNEVVERNTTEQYKQCNAEDGDGTKQFTFFMTLLTAVRKVIHTLPLSIDRESINLFWFGLHSYCSSQNDYRRYMLVYLQTAFNDEILTKYHKPVEVSPNTTSLSSIGTRVPASLSSVEAGTGTGAGEGERGKDDSQLITELESVVKIVRWWLDHKEEFSDINRRLVQCIPDATIRARCTALKQMHELTSAIISNDWVSNLTDESKFDNMVEREQFLEDRSLPELITQWLRTTHLTAYRTVYHLQTALTTVILRECSSYLCGWIQTEMSTLISNFQQTYFNTPPPCGDTKNSENLRTLIEGELFVPEGNLKAPFVLPKDKVHENVFHIVGTTNGAPVAATAAFLLAINDLSSEDPSRAAPILKYLFQTTENDDANLLKIVAQMMQEEDGKQPIMMSEEERRILIELTGLGTVLDNYTLEALEKTVGACGLPFFRLKMCGSVSGPYSGTEYCSTEDEKRRRTKDECIALTLPSYAELDMLVRNLKPQDDVSRILFTAFQNLSSHPDALTTTTKPWSSLLTSFISKKTADDVVYKTTVDWQLFLAFEYLASEFYTSRAGEPLKRLRFLLGCTAEPIFVDKLIKLLRREDKDELFSTADSTLYPLGQTDRDSMSLLAQNWATFLLFCVACERASGPKINNSTQSALQSALYDELCTFGASLCHKHAFTFGQVLDTAHSAADVELNHLLGLLNVFDPEKKLYQFVNSQEEDDREVQKSVVRLFSVILCGSAGAEQERPATLRMAGVLPLPMTPTGDGINIAHAERLAAALFLLFPYGYADWAVKNMDAWLELAGSKPLRAALKFAQIPQEASSKIEIESVSFGKLSNLPLDSIRTIGNTLIIALQSTTDLAASAVEKAATSLSITAPIAGHIQTLMKGILTWQEEVSTSKCTNRSSEECGNDGDPECVQLESSCVPSSFYAGHHQSSTSFFGSTTKKPDDRAQAVINVNTATQQLAKYFVTVVDGKDTPYTFQLSDSKTDLDVWMKRARLIRTLFLVVVLKADSDDNESVKAPHIYTRYAEGIERFRNSWMSDDIKFTGGTQVLGCNQRFASNPNKSDCASVVVCPPRPNVRRGIKRKLRARKIK